MSTKNQGVWIPKDPYMCELEGPYECPHCGYHVMLDATYLDQIAERSSCPGCRYTNIVPAEDKPETYDGDDENE
jgi:ribosomal protein S27AE